MNEGGEKRILHVKLGNNINKIFLILTGPENRKTKGG